MTSPSGIWTRLGGSLRIRAWCLCGASMDARSTPPDAAIFAHDSFRQVHSRGEHGPCTREEAAKSRRRQRAQETNAWT